MVLLTLFDTNRNKHHIVHHTNILLCFLLSSLSLGYNIFFLCIGEAFNAQIKIYKALLWPHPGGRGEVGVIMVHY